MERVAEGLWKVPDDLAKRGRQYDAQRLGTLRNRELAQATKDIAAETGLGFSLVPWRPVIEQRLGQQLVATVRGGGVSWEVGRQRDPSIG